MSRIFIGAFVAIAISIALYLLLPQVFVRNAPSSSTPKTYIPDQTSAPPPQPVRVEPSFNCAKAHTANELLICRDNRLAELDNRMVAAYRQALKDLTPDARRTFERAHFQWFIEYSRTCNSSPDDNQRSACIANYLQEHTSALQGAR